MTIDERELSVAYEFFDQARFRDAYNVFNRIAKQSSSPSEKAPVLLKALTALRSEGALADARLVLSELKDLVPVVLAETKTDPERKEAEDVSIGVDLEEQLIRSGAGDPVGAAKGMDVLLARMRTDLHRSDEDSFCLTVKTQKAFVLADAGMCAEALPLLERLVQSGRRSAGINFYLGHCHLVQKDYRSAKRYLEQALQGTLWPNLEFRAHCSLGMVYYHLEDYANAKSELEIGVRSATPDYIRRGHLWKWLEYSCRALGQTTEADRYARLHEKDV